MNRDQFTDLPLKTALGILFDIAHAKIEQIPAPTLPRSPKYDDRLPRKGGFIWTSEMLLADLIWWREKKRESADGGGQYAEKDAKLVGKLDKWIEWRSLYPSETWSGTRGDDRATAAPPSKEPKLQPWGERTGNSGGQRASTPEPEPEEEKYDF